MPSYQAPLRDMRFVMDEMLNPHLLTTLHCQKVMTLHPT